MTAAIARLSHGLADWLTVRFNWSILTAFFADSCPTNEPGCTGSECHGCVWDKAIK